VSAASTPVLPGSSRGSSHQVENAAAIARTLPPPSGRTGASREALNTTEPTPMPRAWKTVIPIVIAGIQGFIPTIRVARTMNKPVIAMTGNPIAATRTA
jgi:hypothetical protein